MNGIDYASFANEDSTANRRFVIAIFGISGVLSAVILSIGFYKKVHRSLLSEFMMYIIISEIINSLSKLLSLNRKHITIPFENFRFELEKVIQLYIGVLVDSCTIFTTLIISIKIYDGAALGSRVFNSKMVQIGARISIFALPLFLSIVLGSIHMATYTDPGDSMDHTHIEKLCDLISCRVDDPILMGQYAIFILFIGATLIVNVLTLTFLGKKKKEIAERLVNQKAPNSLMKSFVDNIDSSRFKVYLFPFINIIIWLGFIITNLCYYTSTKGGLKKAFYSKEYLWAYSIFHGCRGVLYSLLFIFTRKELINYIFCLYLCKKNLNEDDDEAKISNEMNNKESLIKENEQDDADEELDS